MRYLMGTKSDCGPQSIRCAAVAAGVLAEPEAYQQILAAWPHGWHDCNSQDSPIHHDALCAALKIKRRIIDCGTILRGEAPPEKTVILIHGTGGVLNALIKQHWCILAPGAPVGQIYLYLGQVAGQMHSYSHEKFAELYSGALPACAYVVGDPAGEVPVLTWRQRLWLWVSSTWIMRKVMG
jgi:hypothetical protein